MRGRFALWTGVGILGLGSVTALLAFGLSTAACSSSSGAGGPSADQACTDSAHAVCSKMQTCARERPDRIRRRADLRDAHQVVMHQLPLGAFHRRRSQLDGGLRAGVRELRVRRLSEQDEHPHGLPAGDGLDRDGRCVRIPRAMSERLLRGGAGQRVRQVRRHAQARRLVRPAHELRSDAHLLERHSGVHDSRRAGRRLRVGTAVRRWAFVRRGWRHGHRGDLPDRRRASRRHLRRQLEDGSGLRLRARLLLRRQDEAVRADHVHWRGDCVRLHGRRGHARRVHRWELQQRGLRRARGGQRRLRRPGWRRGGDGRGVPTACAVCRDERRKRDVPGVDRGFVPLSAPATIERQNATPSATVPVTSAPTLDPLACRMRALASLIVPTCWAAARSVSETPGRVSASTPPLKFPPSVR
jgi:hypothetical protein